MVTTLEDVPTEIQFIIYDKICQNAGDVLQSSLVCSKWKSIFQKLFYANIELVSYGQLDRFLEAVKANVDLGDLLVKLTFKFESNNTNYERNHLITNLLTYLPNLQCIDCSYGKIYYTLILDALMSNYLPRLNYIHPPRNHRERHDYSTVAVYLKDRLKSLSITEYIDKNENSSDRSEQGFYSVQFHRLFDRLDQFKLIRELDLQKKTDNAIEIIEQITSKCRFLKRLTISLSMSETNTVDVGSLSINDYASAFNIDELTCTGNAFSKSQVVHYVIHKFPTLQKFVFNQDLLMDDITLDNLLTFIINIRTVSINLQSTGQSIKTSLGPFWERISQKNTLAVRFKYQSPKPFAMFSLILENNTCHNNISFPVGSNLVHFNIVERYGRCFDRLTLQGIRSALLDQSQELPFIALFLHPIEHCIRLEHLSVTRCNLKNYIIALDPAFKVSFNYLTLEHCSFTLTVSQSLSSLFARIKYLNVLDIKANDRGRNDINSVTIINMAETDVDHLTLSFSRAQFDVQRQKLLLAVSIGNIYGRYWYDLETMNDRILKPISADQSVQSLNDNNCYSVPISFRSLNSIKVDFRGVLITMEIV